MNYHKILFLILTITLSSCSIKGQQPDNTKPMYGEVPKNDEYKKADEDFKNDCLKQNKTIDSSVNFLVDRAWRFFYNKDLQTAMKRFNQAWLLNPEFPDSYFGFAALMDMRGDTVQSKRFYSIGEEKDKTKERSKKCYQSIAYCEEQLQNYNGVIDAYIKLTKLRPDYAFAFKKLGFFQMQIGNHKEALIAYGKAIELDSIDPMTYNNRGYLYQTEKNYKNAIADYSKALDLDSKSISAHVNRGMTLMAEKNFEAAKKDFEVCVQLDSKSGELRRYLGLSKLELNDTSGACQDFNSAKELGDNQAQELIKESCK